MCCARHTNAASTAGVGCGVSHSRSYPRSTTHASRNLMHTFGLIETDTHCADTHGADGGHSARRSALSSARVWSFEPRGFASKSGGYPRNTTHASRILMLTFGLLETHTHCADTHGACGRGRCRVSRENASHEGRENALRSSLDCSACLPETRHVAPCFIHGGHCPHTHGPHVTRVSDCAWAS